jgi:Ala-tRNA(Pro) deacylase
MSYEVVRHPRTFSSMETAEAAHVPGDRVAKSVVVENDTGYMIAVIPATHRLLFGALRERFGTGFGLATEAEIAALFADCEKGAIPPFGEAYGLRVLVDQDLLDEDELYCESGDHSELLHLRGRDFRALMAGAERGGFSRHV